jgi:NAD(P)-dependent dehydrogenase (short-subunit alcohol dehydrogenase family)
LGSRSSIEHFSVNLIDLLSTAQEDVLTKEPVIDVLINNAGIFVRSLDQNYVNGIEEHIYVNYLGHVLLTHLLWPTLERSGARVVSVSSIGAVLPTNPLAGWYPSDQQWSDKFSITSGLLRYFRSKRANLMFAHKLHQHTIGSTISPASSSVSSVVSHPGSSRSEIWLNGGKCIPSFLSKWFFTNPIISMTSSQGALTQVWAALDRTQVPSGSAVGPRWWLHGNPILLGSIQQPTVPFHHFPFAADDVDDQLWEHTMQVLGIQTFGQPVDETRD